MVAWPLTCPLRPHTRLCAKRIVLFSRSGTDIRCCLADLPGIAGAEKFGEVACAAFFVDFLQLFMNQIFIAGQGVPGTKNADGCWKAFAMFHVREQKSVGRARMMRVMNEQIGLGDAIS